MSGPWRYPAAARHCIDECESLSARTSVSATSLALPCSVPFSSKPGRSPSTTLRTLNGKTLPFYCRSSKTRSQWPTSSAGTSDGGSIARTACSILTPERGGGSTTLKTVAQHSESSSVQVECRPPAAPPPTFMSRDSKATHARLAEDENPGPQLGWLWTWIPRRCARGSRRALQSIAREAPQTAALARRWDSSTRSPSSTMTANAPMVYLLSTVIPRSILAQTDRSGIRVTPAHELRYPKRAPSGGLV